MGVKENYKSSQSNGSSEESEVGFGHDAHLEAGTTRERAFVERAARFAGDDPGEGTASRAFAEGPPHRWRPGRNWTRIEKRASELLLFVSLAPLLIRSRSYSIEGEHPVGVACMLCNRIPTPVN